MLCRMCILFILLLFALECVVFVLVCNKSAMVKVMVDYQQHWFMCGSYACPWTIPFSLDQKVSERCEISHFFSLPMLNIFFSYHIFQIFFSLVLFISRRSLRWLRSRRSKRRSRRSFTGRSAVWSRPFCLCCYCLWWAGGALSYMLAAVCEAYRLCSSH